MGLILGATCTNRVDSNQYYHGIADRKNCNKDAIGHRKRFFEKGMTQILKGGKKCERLIEERTCELLEEWKGGFYFETDITLTFAHAHTITSNPLWYFGGIPLWYISVEFCLVKHAYHGGHLGGVPLRHVSVEWICFIKHPLHISYAGCVPFWQVPVK